jgi:hypothetical protein
MKKLLPYLLGVALFALTANAINIGATAYANAALSNSPVLAERGSAVLSGVDISNVSNATIYVQFFDANSISGISVGTTPPLFWLAVPVNAVLDGPSSAVGVGFQNGVVVAATTTPTGSTAPSANIPVVVITN